MRKLTLKTERLAALDAGDLLRVNAAASGLTCLDESMLLMCNTQLECLLTQQGCLTGGGCG